MAGSDRLKLGIAGLWERALEASAWAGEGAGPQGGEPCVADVVFGGMWLAVRLDDGAVGRAFVFTGAHEVYGPTFSPATFDLLVPMVGMGVREAYAWADSARGERDFGCVLAGGLAVALVNAVAAPGNAPEALAARGLALHDDCVAELVRPDDQVVVVGAGMFMRELRNRCGQIDVVDLRPACDLQCVHVGAQGVRRAPEGIRFHTSPDDTAGLLADADVFFLTGCTLVNRTFFELMALPRRAREVVLFGPSGAAPFEALAELGVTCVASSWVADPEGLVDELMHGKAARQLSREVTRGYTVTFPRDEGAPARGAARAS